MIERLIRLLAGLGNRRSISVNPNMKPRIVVAAIVAAGVYMYLRRRLASARCRSGTLLHGKTAIVTGANRGIGKEVARDLARRGARVILACRSLKKGQEAVLQIEKSSKGELVVYQLDLSSLKSIRHFAEKIIHFEERVDILVNNAGTICPKATTEEGLDMQFCTNYLGPFLLTVLLLDKMKASAAAKIINTSSSLHSIGKLNWDDLNMAKWPKFYKPMAAYAQSKLALLLFSRELASRLSGTRVNVYSVDPGKVNRDQTGHRFEKYSPLLTTIGFNLLSFLLPLVQTVREAAQTTIFCAVDKKVERKSGMYYRNCESKRPDDNALDKLNQKTLWEVSMKMAGLQE